MWWYAFLPSLLATVVGIISITYQFFAFKRSPLFDDAPKSFLMEVIETGGSFFSQHQSWIFPSIIGALVIGAVYLLLPTICQGALIQLSARMRSGQHAAVAKGISLGLIVFLPLFAYHLIVNTFSFLFLFKMGGLFIRNLPSALELLMPVIIFLLIVGFILSLLFTYSEFFIVLEKKPVLASMGLSAKLVIMSWQHTFLIGILMAIIGVRVVINVVAVMLVPALLFFSAGLLATITHTAVGFIIGGALSAVALFFASYVNGILNVFANSVWTFTFMELRQKKEIAEVVA